MTKTTTLALLAIVPALGVIMSSATIAYSATGPRWAEQVVPYVVNPTNLDLPEASVEPALRAGAEAWAMQSGANVGLEHTGRSSQTTTGYDGVNLVLFRNASSGSAIATAYWWSSANRIIDGDIVFWDGAFRFFAGTSGCSGGFYIEDIATHEFGHILGLGHSDVSGATMYPSTSSCNANNRTLHADDIAGIEFLYPGVIDEPRPVMNLRIVGS